jgi:hypothetical protein
MPDLFLLPQPRSLETLAGQRSLAAAGYIVLQAPEPASLLFSARRLQAVLREYAGVDWQLSAFSLGPEADRPEIILSISPELNLGEQGHNLLITPSAIRVEAKTAQGLFYGIITLVQIIQQAGKVLPCLKISDRPDFEQRGVMLDISRDKVPTLETLLNLVDMLAGWKINQLQLYTEHTFAYRKHGEVWAEASPFTGEEILQLDAFCRERFIELVPNQNSFGHMQRWLIHQRYMPMAETTGTYRTPWSVQQGPYSLCPTDPASLHFLAGLYDELLPHFSSPMFNVGCDETFDLGQGRSKEICERLGTGQVYLDFLLKIYEMVKARGHTMQFWGDIIIQHPELVPKIPQDVIALEWGYEADHPFDEHCAHFAAAGIPFYVCPGTSAWCSLAGRSENATGNLLNAAEAGLKHGANGYLITDWGDLGHWQAFPVSYLGLLAGAALSWSLETNRNIDFPSQLNLHAFRDEAGVMGRLAYDLGNVYRLTGLKRVNASYLFWLLQRPLDWTPPPELLPVWAKFPPPTAETLLETLEMVERIMLPLEQSRMRRGDAALIQAEYQLTARLMRHACQRGFYWIKADVPGKPTIAELDQDMQEIIEEYRRVWLARNRPGGLNDSAARFDALSLEYAALMGK